MRGVSYNIHTIRCDGNDVWAVYNVTKMARQIAVGKVGQGLGLRVQGFPCCSDTPLVDATRSVRR